MQQAPKYKRKLFMQSATQNRILVGFCLAPIAALVIMLVIVIVYLDQLVAELIAADVEVESLSPLLISLCAFVVVSAGVTLFQALRHSQKIAGPAIGIGNTLRRVREGETDARVRLRDGDYLVEIADDINSTLDALTSQAPVPQEAELVGSGATSD